MGKFWWGKILVNLANYELFAPIFTDIPKNVFDVCTDCSLFTKTFLTNSCYLYGLPKFPLPYISHVLYVKVTSHASNKEGVPAMNNDGSIVGLTLNFLYQLNQVNDGRGLRWARVIRPAQVLELMDSSGR